MLQDWETSFHLETLLKSGADPNLPDEFNVLPLLEAVKNNYHDMLALLHPMASPLEFQPYGSTLLHWIARYGNQTTFEVFQNFPQINLFSETAVTDLDKMGLRAQDVFDQRLEATESEKMSFNLLIQKISGADSDDESDDVSLFRDAEKSFSRSSSVVAANFYCLAVSSVEEIRDSGP